MTFCSVHGCQDYDLFVSWARRTQTDISQSVSAFRKLVKDLENSVFTPNFVAAFQGRISCSTQLPHRSRLAAVWCRKTIASCKCSTPGEGTNRTGDFSAWRMTKERLFTVIYCKYPSVNRHNLVKKYVHQHKSYWMEMCLVLHYPKHPDYIAVAEQANVLHVE